MSIFCLAGLGADLIDQRGEPLGVLGQVTAQQIGRLVDHRAKAIALEARLDRIEPDGRDRHARDQEDGARLRERRRTGLELTDHALLGVLVQHVVAPVLRGLDVPGREVRAGSEGGGEGDDGDWVIMAGAPGQLVSE